MTAAVMAAAMMITAMMITAMMAAAVVATTMVTTAVVAAAMVTATMMTAAMVTATAVVAAAVAALRHRIRWERQRGCHCGDVRIEPTIRHGRACPGHPRFCFLSAFKTWMPATSAGMTIQLKSHPALSENIGELARPASLLHWAE
jgi:hypothetical protein